MKILCVTFSFPAPARSGAERRLAGLLGGLLPRHEVAIVALRRGEPDAAFAARFAFTTLLEPPPPRRPLPAGLGRLRAWSGILFGALPGFARATATRAFEAAVDGALDRFQPDVVYVEPAGVAHLVARIKRAGRPVCFGTIELVSEKTARWMELTRTATHRFAARRELERTRRLEYVVLRAADAVLCVSDADRAAIKSWTGADATVVPNAVDADYFTPLPVQREPATFLAVGPLTYEANLDAVEWFASAVLPELPHARLDVIGRLPTTAAGFGDRTHALGMVEDVRPHLARATALVAPLRIGGGTRLKILEALAMRTPVISTSIGVEGLELMHGEHVLIADDARSFIRQARAIMDDPDLAERIGRKGAELVERRYGWERSVEALEETLGKIARPASRASR
jgi:glycosyltransferase involved in cell wall biosynthesis